MTRLVFIEDQKLKRARAVAQHMVYKLKMIFFPTTFDEGKKISRELGIGFGYARTQN